jgi:GPH family glycoside/pentoside/hexuronide:cation symporter
VLPASGPQARLPLRLKLLYAAGSLGTGLFASVTGVLLLVYMTDTLGIAAALAGVVLFIGKAWDVVFDPLVGIASDRSSSRWGRRQPFLLAGGLVTALAFWALFSPPAGDTPAARALFVGVVFLVAMSGYAVFAVPYAAMPAEMSADPHERTAIMSFRMGFVLLGTLAGAVAGPMIVAAGGGGAPGYAAMAALLAALIAAAMLTTALAARAMPTRGVAATHLGAREQLRLALANRPYFVLLWAYALVLVGNGAMAAAAPYFVVHALGRSPDAVGLVFASLLLAAIVAMPVWVAVARRVGKRNAALGAVALFGTALLALALPGTRGSLPLVLALCALAGVGFAGSQLLPFSLLTDVIEADRQATGLHREASYTGLFIAAEKAGLALGPLITAMLLDAHGFVASSDGAAAQPAGVALAAALAFGAVPAVLCALAMAMLWRLAPPGGSR